MEKNETPSKIVRRYFVVIELVLLMLAISVVGLFYNHTPGAAFLLIITQILLVGWYGLKTITPDQQLGFKPKVMYIGFAVACLAVMFALLKWPGDKIILVGALACLAIGWGIFLWSRQRNQHHHQHQPAASYMMFLRLVLYTTACLVLLLSGQDVFFKP